MSRMVRKQVYLERRHEEFLKRRAKELGVSEAELIRRGIEQAALSPVVLPPDRGAWEEAKTLIRERMRLAVPQTGRSWARNDLYDERLQRLSP